jgi:hypothetical protein
MSRRITLLSMTLAVCFGATFGIFAQQPAPAGRGRGTAGAGSDFDAHRPPRVFRAEWKRETGNAPQRPLVQGDLLNQNLELKIYGGHRPTSPTTCPTSSCPYGIGVIWVQHNQEPTYAWTGLCEINCAVTVRDKTNDVDMTGLSRIRWRSMQAGYHLLRPIIKLANGTWLAGDHVDGATTDWRETDMTIGDMRWRTLDMTKVVEGPDGKWVDNPDLSKVEEFGFTDLTIGADHGRGGSSRVAWIEVYGKAVPRAK